MSSPRVVGASTGRIMTSNAFKELTRTLPAILTLNSVRSHPDPRRLASRLRHRADRRRRMGLRPEPSVSDVTAGIWWTVFPGIAIIVLRITLGANRQR